jgi:hypothetical protein
MKPANFPGRRNDRRKAAFDRMVDPRLKHADKKDHFYYQTKKKILPDDVAYNIRTKKDRSARGKFRK